MKFTLSLLKTFLKTDASLDQITNALTAIGLEVENVVDKRVEFEHFRVAEILEATPHPNADKLKVCKVLSTEGELQIVCGAPNARAGIKVILAKIGSLIPNGNFQIKAAAIRGVSSNGMLCSAEELMIGPGDGGIVELPNHAIVGEEFTKYYGLDDPVIEISVTPNRGDCLGVYYIAKELAAKGLGEFNYHFNESKGVGIDGGSEACPIFASIEINNIKNQPSPEWLQILLKNIGQTSISAVVDITNYMCISFARPMHAYDKDKLSGDLKIEFAKTGERFAALNNKEYALSSEDLVIRDSNHIQSLAGIIGGSLSSCDEMTTNITLEAAIFDPILIARTGRRHRIDTESRHRLERGVDPELLVPVLNLAATMITEMCGGERSEILVRGNISSTKKTITFDPKEMQRVVGFSLPREKVTTILRQLDFNVEDCGNVMELTIPSHRHDINIQEDVVEEIIRIHGLEHIPLTPLPDRHISRVLTTTQRRSFDIRRILASVGYDELVTWSFMDHRRAKMFSNIRSDLQLQNPISQELDYMRPSIIPNILGSMEKNLARSMANLAFFETGPIFGDTETLSVAAAKIGNIRNKNPHDSEREVDVFDIKGDVELILQEMGIKLEKCAFVDAPSYYHPHRSASISLGKNILGHFGEIHPNVLELYDITKRIVAFEINIDTVPVSKLKYGYKDSVHYSDYQTVTRDFAFIVDIDTPTGPMISYIQNIDKTLIREVHLFDVYSGVNITQGKKSLGFSALFQANDHTMNDEEIQALSTKIVEGMRSKYLATIRAT